MNGEKTPDQFQGSSQPLGPSLLTKSTIAWTASWTLFEREWLPCSTSTFSAPPITLHNLRRVHEEAFKSQIFLSIALVCTQI
ncbi:hypothetical protein OIU79_003719 [Salix purpurea]|uniref:Uncharacterized protein n=1 Tax=Salix purpurea TaxID=77065 RepID=A0A9Q0Z8T0_SALPP|nr:hypothetical protein OIU79_003719 [Salix purpurea]